MRQAPIGRGEAEIYLSCFFIGTIACSLEYVLEIIYLDTGNFSIKHKDLLYLNFWVFSMIVLFY
jgi:hypothetical protein